MVLHCACGAAAYVSEFNIQARHMLSAVPTTYGHITGLVVMECIVCVLYPQNKIG